jgi:anti-sigma28 factor (negative regulator of flagellin synthesis)
MDSTVKPAKRKRCPAKTAASAPPVVDDKVVDVERQEKLARLKKSLDDGTYRVSTEEVARKVIEYMRKPKD